MYNELLWILLIIVTFSLQTIGFILFGKRGIYIWCAISTILANIQVIMTVSLFGLVATLGNIIYGASFLSTDVLSEIWGRKEAKKGVWIGFFTLLSSMVLMWLCIQFIPHATDFAHPHLEAIFGIFPRIVIASLAGYLVSQHHDVFAYLHLKEKYNKDSQIWIRNNLSTMVSQLIDSVIFCFIAFWGVWSISVFLQILVTTYIFKWIVSASDTPFIYLMKYLKGKGKINIYG